MTMNDAQPLVPNETTLQGEESNNIDQSLVEDSIPCSENESKTILESNEGTVVEEKDNSNIEESGMPSVSRLLLILNEIKKREESTSFELREIRKLYHNEFSGRLQSMQKELSYYHEVEKCRVFDDILIDISRLYSDNLNAVEKIEDLKVKKQLSYMFLDMLQILESHGAIRFESKIGDRRNTKYCQVIERIPTDNPELHDRIAQSRSVGFYIENRALIKEMVDVFIYTKPNEKNPI